MFLDITPTESATLPRYTGEMELTNHSAGSLTSQAYQKRWLRKEELLADAAEKSSIAAEWLGARPYPLQRLKMDGLCRWVGIFTTSRPEPLRLRLTSSRGNDDVIAMNLSLAYLTDAAEGVAAALNTETEGVPLLSSTR